MMDHRDFSSDDVDAEANRAGPGSSGLGRAVVGRIPVKVQAVLGVARLTVSHLAELERGGVIELDRKIGEPVDVLVNGHPVGRGEIVVVDDPTPHFAVRITDVFSRNTVG